MTSGIIPWTRQLELCSRWLEIIRDELPLRAQSLDTEQAKQLASDALTLLTRAKSLFDALKQIAETPRAIS